MMNNRTVWLYQGRKSEYNTITKVFATREAARKAKKFFDIPSRIFKVPVFS